MVGATRSDTVPSSLRSRYASAIVFMFLTMTARFSRRVGPFASVQMGNPSSILNATVRRADAPGGGARVASFDRLALAIDRGSDEAIRHAAQHHNSAEWRRQGRDEIAVIAPPKRAADHR